MTVYVNKLRRQVWIFMGGRSAPPPPLFGLSADSEDELGSIDTLTNNIVAQAERFVTARTAQLADLNARLGELGPAPTAGGNAENHQNCEHSHM